MALKKGFKQLLAEAGEKTHGITADAAQARVFARRAKPRLGGLGHGAARLAGALSNDNTRAAGAGATAPFGAWKSYSDPIYALLSRAVVSAKGSGLLNR